MIEPPPPPQRGNSELASEKDPFQIDRDRLFPDFFARVDRVVVAVEHDARVVEQDVELAEQLFGRRDHRLAVGRFGHVGMNVGRAASLFFDERDRLLSGRVVHIDRHDRGPFAAKEKCRLPADPASRSGNQGDFVFELHEFTEPHCCVEKKFSRGGEIAERNCGITLFVSRFFPYSASCAPCERLLSSPPLNGMSAHWWIVRRLSSHC